MCNAQIPNHSAISRTIFENMDTKVEFLFEDLGQIDFFKTENSIQIFVNSLGSTLTGIRVNLDNT